jgi:hypothetical protein
MMQPIGFGFYMGIGVNLNDDEGLYNFEIL